MLLCARFPVIIKLLQLIMPHKILSLKMWILFKLQVQMLQRLVHRALRFCFRFVYTCMFLLSLSLCSAFLLPFLAIVFAAWWWIQSMFCARLIYVWPGSCMGAELCGGMFVCDNASIIALDLMKGIKAIILWCRPGCSEWPHHSHRPERKYTSMQAMVATSAFSPLIVVIALTGKFSWGCEW